VVCVDNCEYYILNAVEVNLNGIFILQHNAYKRTSIGRKAMLTPISPGSKKEQTSIKDPNFEGYQAEEIPFVYYFPHFFV